MTRIVYIDKDECTSCEACTDNLPDFFQVDEQTLAETHNNGANINKAEIPVDKIESVQEEIDQCPGECILWH